MRPIRKKKFLLSALGALAVVYLLNLIVDNPYTHKTVRAKLDELLAETTHLAVDYQIVRVQILPPAVDLYGLEVYRRTDDFAGGRTGGGSDGGPGVGKDGSRGNQVNGKILKAAHLRATVSIWSIMIGLPQLASFEVNDSELNIDDFSRLNELFKASESKTDPSDKGRVWPPDFRVPVRDVIFRSASFAIFEPGLDRRVPLTPTSSMFLGNNIDLEVSIKAWDEIDLAIDAADVTLRAAGTTYIAGAGLSATVDYNSNTVDAKIRRLDSAGLRGFGGGRIEVDQILPTLDISRISGVAELDVSGDIRLVGSLLDIPGTYGSAKVKVKSSFDVPVGERKRGSIAPSYTIFADVESMGARFGGFKLLESRAKLDIDAGRIKFSDVEIITAGKLQATGSGVLNLDGPGGYDFKMATKSMPLSRMLDIFNVEFDVFDTEMTSDDLTISGSSNPFEMKVAAGIAGTNLTLPSVEYDQSRFPASPLCMWNLRLGINSSLIDFDGTNVSCKNDPTGTPSGPLNASMTLSVSGPVTFDDRSGIDLKIAATDVHPAVLQYFAQVPMSGSGRFSTRIHGPYDHIVLDGDIFFESLALAGVDFGKLSGNWGVDGEVVSWENVLAVPEEGSSVTIESGALEVKENMTIKSELVAANLSPNFVGRFLRLIGVSEPVQFGVETLRGGFSGDLEAPLWWNVRAGVTIYDLDYERRRFVDHLSARIEADAEGWRIWDVNGARGDLNLDGRVRLTRSEARRNGRGNPGAAGISGKDHLEIDAKLNSLSNYQSEVDHVSTLPYLEQVFAELGLSGFVSGSAKLGGPIERLEGSFDLAVLKPRLLESQVAPVRFKGIVAGEKTEMLISHGGNALEGRFVVDYSRKSLPYEWFFTAKRMDLRFVASPWFAADPRNYLYLTGSWSMRGELANFWRSNGQLLVSGINGRLLREVTGERKVLDFNVSEPFSLRLVDGAVSTGANRNLTVSTDDAMIRAMIRPGMRLPGNINVGIDGQVNLALVRDMLPILESASGRVAFKGSLGGALNKPVYSFEISDVRANPLTASSWEPVSIGLADFRPPLKNIRLKANLKNGLLNIESLTASKGAGRIDGTGTLVFGEGDLGDSNLDFRLEDASLVYPVAVLKSFESTVSGNITLTGKSAPYRLAGDLNITRARSTREIDIGAEILSAIRQQSIAIPSVAAAPVVQFDLSINADQSVNVNNRLIQALLSTNLRVGGTDQQPSILGQIDVNRGKFVYKRDFSITRGVISFDDPLHVDPTLEINAVSEIQNYRVYISVTGRASAPKVDFSVDPPNRQNGTPISKVDILVLLGRGSLPEEQQALGETQNVAATEALGFIWGQLDEPIEKLFDMSGQRVVKEVYFDTYASPDGKPLLRVNLPLNLGNDLDVVLRVDQEQSMKLSSEFSVSENISLGVGVERLSQTATSENQSTVPADTGADLKFRFAFP